jgi:hypothetical protein
VAPVISRSTNWNGTTSPSNAESQFTRSTRFQAMQIWPHLILLLELEN